MMVLLSSFLSCDIWWQRVPVEVIHTFEQKVKHINVPTCCNVHHSMVIWNDV